MVYRVIGLMSGSSLDGLDIVFAEIEENRSNWSFEIMAAACIAYSTEWKTILQNATNLTAKDYMILDTAYGKYTGEIVNDFINKNSLQHKVQLIASHGHTTFHLPEKNTTVQLGDGAAIAAVTGINTVSDLRNMDIALGGQGAPIVPLGEILLFPGYNFYLNIGGIANVSGMGYRVSGISNAEAGSNPKPQTPNLCAFDICPANRVLNMLAQTGGKEYDEGGEMSSSGNINAGLLLKLNALDYYKKSFPKSLANEFGTDIIYPLIQEFNLSTADALRTYTEHIAMQIAFSLNEIILKTPNTKHPTLNLLITGGGAFNSFLILRIKELLQPLNIEIILPNEKIINYKEALIVALLGVLRWREENTVLHLVTGATRSSIGGAVWIGQEA